MKKSPPPVTIRTLRAENADLRARLAEAEDTLRAIRAGDVDALVVEGDNGPQIFTLQGLDAEQNRSRGEMLAQVSDSVIAVDNEEHITFLNAVAERQYGVRADEVVGRKLDSVITRHWPSPEAEAEMWTAMGERGEWHGEMIHRTHDGRELHIESSAAALRGPGGERIGVVRTIRDVSVRKQLELEKAEALRLLDTLLTHAPVGFVFLDRDLRFVRINERLAEINGLTIAAHLGKTVAEILPTLAATLLAVTARILATGQPVLDHEFSGETARMPGITRYWNQSWYPVHDERGEIMGFGGVVDEITERKRAEGELRESEVKLRDQLSRLALLEQITRGISSRLDFQHILKVVTHSLEDALPVDFCCVCLFDEQAKQCAVAQVGLKSAPLALELAMPEHAVISLDCVALAPAARGELSYLQDVREMEFPFLQRLAQAGLRSLVVAPLPLEGKVIGFLMVARREACGFPEGECEFLKQLSEHVALACQQAKLHDSLQAAYDALRRTQRAAMQRDRLRALGQMASGIAHDISNAISPVTLYAASLLEHESDLSVRARDYLRTIHQSVLSVAETIARMREFYRPDEPQVMLTPVHLNHLAQQALDLTRVRWSDGPHERGIVIQTEVRLAEDLPDIMGIESEIRDAIVNLIFNAVDAMPEGGTLTLRTVAEPITPGTGGTPDARQACLELIDTGIGMDEATRRRCLEPFFTTKGEHGSGLGLAMVDGMTTRHRAQIEIESTPGQGTTARLLFPVSEVDSRGVDPPLEAKPEPANQRILFIDDDPRLLKSIYDTLETDGHTVVTAAGGQEGIRAFIQAQKRQEAFTVVITDLGMPHADGRKVASAVKAASPSTPVIMLTGWGHQLEAEGNIPAQVDRLLSKPPNLRELREALVACCPPDPSKPTNT